MAPWLSIWRTAAAYGARAGALFSLYLALSRLRTYWRLRHFHGPLLAYFSELWVFQRTYAGDLHEKSLEVLKKYGGPESVARLGPNLLTTDNVVFWKAINESRAWKKGSWYPAMALDPGHDSVFSTTDDVRHDTLKSQLARGYSGKDNANLEADIEGVIKTLFQYLDNHDALDLASVAQFFTVDVLSKVAFGKSFGCLPSGTDMYDYVKTSHEFIPILELKLNHSWINAITNTSLFRLLVAPTAEDKKGMGKVMGIAKQIVTERFAMREKFGTTSESKDMLDSFIEKGLTREEAEAESLLQIMAGADSTATALRITLFYIATNPVVWNKLRAAVDEGGTQHPDATFIPAAALRRVPYLQAVIKEGLRMWPPLTGTRVKVAPPEGWVVGGRFIPGGTEVGQCVWGLRSDVGTFGSDAALFRPERWLEAESERLQAMDDAVGTVFGNGRHRCLGKTIAGLELDKAIAEIVRAFDLTIVDPVHPFRSRCNGIHLQSDMNVFASRRKDQ